MEKKSVTYGYVRAVITNKKDYDKEEMLNNLDLFKLGNRITVDEYKELKDIIDNS